MTPSDLVYHRASMNIATLIGPFSNSHWSVPVAFNQKARISAEVIVDVCRKPKVNIQSVTTRSEDQGFCICMCWGGYSYHGGEDVEVSENVLHVVLFCKILCEVFVLIYVKFEYQICNMLNVCNHHSIDTSTRE